MSEESTVELSKRPCAAFRPKAPVCRGYVKLARSVSGRKIRIIS